MQAASDGGPHKGAASFAFITLGCPKNEADSDRIGRILTGAGHRPAPLDQADLLIVNTCGFIDAAKEESIGALLEAAEAAQARGASVAAYGCLVQRYRRELEEELPEVDLFTGFEIDALLGFLDSLGTPRSSAATPVRRRRQTRPTHSYVKVSDGCDRRCTFCAIPLIKGAYEIVEPAEVLAVARAALSRGARELVLVGQDTSRYEKEGYGGIARLLGDLKALGAPWLRLLYLQPEGIDEVLLAAIAEHALPYLDIPLQHASRGVLRAMGRGGDADGFLALLERARTRMPGLAIRSTFLTGFPGETERDVEELLDFIAQAGLAVAGVFPFDPQEGTRAASLPHQVPPELREERAARVGAAIDDAARAFWRALEGEAVDVLVERGSSGRSREALGRIAAQAPDIDGLTALNGLRCRRGQIVRASVETAIGYDLVARAHAATT